MPDSLNRWGIELGQGRIVLAAEGNHTGGPADGVSDQEGPVKYLIVVAPEPGAVRAYQPQLLAVLGSQES